MPISGFTSFLQVSFKAYVSGDAVISSHATKQYVKSVAFFLRKGYQPKDNLVWVWSATAAHPSCPLISLLYQWPLVNGSVNDCLIHLLSTDAIMQSGI